MNISLHNALFVRAFRGNELVVVHLFLAHPVETYKILFIKRSVIFVPLCTKCFYTNQTCCVVITISFVFHVSFSRSYVADKQQIGNNGEVNGKLYIVLNVLHVKVLKAVAFIYSYSDTMKLNRLQTIS